MSSLLIELSACDQCRHVKNLPTVNIVMLWKMYCIFLSLMMASLCTEVNGKSCLGVVCKSTPEAMKVLGVDKKHNGQSKLMQMHDSLLSDMVPAHTSRTGKP